MKIVQISAAYEVTSVGQIVKNIHESLLQNGHESFVFYGRKKRKNRTKNVVFFNNSFSLLLHVFITRIFDSHGLGSIIPTMILIVRLIQLKPNIIHIHNLHGYYLNYPILLSFLKNCKAKKIFTLHDCWTFTGHCSHFLYADCNKWKSECRQCPLLNKYPESKFIDSSRINFLYKKYFFSNLKKSDTIFITPSKWLKSMISFSFLQKFNSRVIHNGIDLKTFKPSNKEFKKKHLNKFIILGVANVWTKEKGIEFFINLSKNLNDDYMIVLIGKIDKIHKLPSNVIFIERTENKEVLTDMYSSADVFINPTLEDTFPTVNIEALACGTPVISFNSGGSIEMLDTKHSKVVNDRNIQTIIKNINNIRSSQINSNELIHHVQQNFDSTIANSKYMNLYEEVS